MGFNSVFKGLRMGGGILTFSHLFSWRAQGRFIKLCEICAFVEDEGLLGCYSTLTGKVKLFTSLYAVTSQKN